MAAEYNAASYPEYVVELASGTKWGHSYRCNLCVCICVHVFVVASSVLDVITYVLLVWLVELLLWSVQQVGHRKPGSLWR